MTGGDHYAMRLNNFAQGRYGSAANRRVRYQVAQSGQQHHTMWQGVYYIDDTKYGTGTGTAKNAAKEAAAKKTIEQLVQEGNVIP